MASLLWFRPEDGRQKVIGGGVAWLGAAAQVDIAIDTVQVGIPGDYSDIL
jgi:hypothetical protein